MFVARWVRPAIEHAKNVPLVGEAKRGLSFLVSLGRVVFSFQPFVWFLSSVLLFFVSVVSFPQT